MSELRWWVCRWCGRKLYEHSRRVVPSAGVREYVCVDAPAGRFESETPARYDPERGLPPPASEAKP
jgi:hypothetical protein